MDAATLFELELVRRGISFTVDASSGRYVVTVVGEPMAVDLSNLRRTLTGNEGDADVVAEFLDADAATAEPQDAGVEDFFWWWAWHTRYVQLVARRRTR